MGFLADAFGGGIKEVVQSGLDFANKRWPPDMSESEKAQNSLIVSEALHRQAAELEGKAQSAIDQLNQRIKEQEGTAKDLLQFGFVGRCIVFLRGCQRPLWGFSLLYGDYLWFFGIGVEFTERQELSLMFINILILGFLFGERTLKNLEPIILKIFRSSAPAPAVVSSRTQ